MRIVTVFKFNIKKIKRLCSMQDFYQQIGIAKWIKDNPQYLHADSFFMNRAECNKLKDLIIQTYTKYNIQVMENSKNIQRPYRYKLKRKKKDMRKISIEDKNKIVIDWIWESPTGKMRVPEGIIEVHRVVGKDDGDR